MVNDAVSRGDIKSFFLGLVREDDRLKNLINDGGLIIEANTLAYKIDNERAKQQADLSEFYYPTSELILLSRLLYEIGYVKFPSPMILQGAITSNVGLILPKNERFTNGTDVFLLIEDVVLVANTPSTALFSREILITKSVTVKNSTLYYKVPLNATYKEISKVECYKDGTLLNYSQQFVDDISDYSLEVDYNGLMVAVFALNNTLGNNIQQGDSLQVNIYKTTTLNETPDNLAIISNVNDIIVENVTLYSNGTLPMGIEEMQDILKYNKNINNSLAYNEDYRNFILKNIQGIDELKVWHQQEEDLENGFSTCNINKIFISYIPTTDGDDFDTQIIGLLEDSVYGKPVVIKTPLVVDLSVSISVIYNTKQIASATTLENIKKTISGYYDDKYSRVSETSIYKIVSSMLATLNTDISISLSSKGSLSNRSFYRIEATNVSISTQSRV